MFHILYVFQAGANMVMLIVRLDILIKRYSGVNIKTEFIYFYQKIRKTIGVYSEDCANQTSNQISQVLWMVN